MPYQRVGGGANNGKAQPVLDYSKFSVRLPESSIENIDDVLLSISKVGVCVESEMKENWFRFSLLDSCFLCFSFLFFFRLSRLFHARASYKSRIDG